MAKVAIILSGCGFMDGSEIHESVLTLLALAQAKHQYRCFAPDLPQRKVVNHLTGKEEEETRNVLVESARIARGEVEPLKQLKVSDFDAVVIPGGFGAALNLSSFAVNQENFQIDEDLKNVLLGFREQNKQIAATCIAPVILAKAFQGKAPLVLTLGSSPESLQHLTQMGMEAIPAQVSDCVVDLTHKVYTTPCYMEPDDLAGMFAGIQKMVEHLG